MTKSRCVQQVRARPRLILRHWPFGRELQRADPRIPGSRLTYRCSVACNAGLSELLWRDGATAVDVASSIKSFATASVATVPASARLSRRRCGGGRRVHCPRGARPLALLLEVVKGVERARAERASTVRAWAQRASTERACTGRARTARASTARARPSVCGRGRGSTGRSTRRTNESCGRSACVPSVRMDRACSRRVRVGLRARAAESGVVAHACHVSAVRVCRALTLALR